VNCLYAPVKYSYSLTHSTETALPYICDHAITVQQFDYSHKVEMLRDTFTACTFTAWTKTITKQAVYQRKTGETGT